MRKKIAFSALNSYARFLGSGLFMIVLLVTSCRKEEPQQTDEPTVRKITPLPDAPDSPGIDLPQDPSRSTGPRKAKYIVKNTLSFTSHGDPLLTDDNRHLLTKTIKSVKYYTLPDGELLFEAPESGRPALFSPDEKYLFTAYNSRNPSGYGRIKVYDLTTGIEIKQLETKNERIKYAALCFSADGRFLFAFGTDQKSFAEKLQKWDVHEGRCIWTKTFEESARQLYCAKDYGWLLILPIAGKGINVINPKTGNPISEFGFDGGYGSARGKLVTMEKMGYLEAYAAGTWELLGTKEITQPVVKGELQPTGWYPWPEKNLIVGYSAFLITFLDSKTLQFVGEISAAPAPDRLFYGVSISPDGETLLVSTDNRTFIGTVVEE